MLRFRDIGLAPEVQSAKDWKLASDERKEVMAQAYLFFKKRIATPDLQKYPTPEIGVQLVFGSSPKDLFPELTTAEANSFCQQTEYEKPVLWLWDQACKIHPELAEAPSAPHNIPVIRWIVGVMESEPRKKSALREYRSHHGFRLRITGTVLTHLDEIVPQDLVKSPWRTVERAVQRNFENKWSGENELIPEPKWEKTLPKGVTLLRHYSSLHIEGEELDHCVAAYAKRVREKQCLIFSLNVEGERSTLEVRDGKIGQHVTIRNQPPSSKCVQLAKKLESQRPWNG